MAATPKLQKFLKFSQSRRDVYISELDAVVSDFKESRLLEAMYSQDEVTALLDDLSFEIKEAVRRSLDQTAHGAGVVLEQVILQASDAGADVEIDLSRVQDEGTLKRIGAIRLDEPIGKDDDAPRKGNVQLVSIRDEHQRLIASNESMASEIAALREKNAAALAAHKQAMDDKAAVAASLATVRRELEATRKALGDEKASAAAAVHAAAESGEVISLKGLVDSLRKELAEAQRAVTAAHAAAPSDPTSTKAIQQSKPFMQMRQLLARKNTQLAELRVRLGKYEGSVDMDGDAEEPLK